MCQNYIKYVISPIPYFDLNERIFSTETDDVHEACTKRSEGRLKNYTSCTDSRAWHFDQDQRRRHLIDIMRNDAGRKGYCVPVTLLYELLSSNSEIGNSENCACNLNPMTTRKALNSLRSILQVVRVPADKQAANRCANMEQEIQMKYSTYNLPMASVQSNLNMVAARIKSMSDFTGVCDGRNCRTVSQLRELDDYVKCIQNSITRFGEEMSEHMRVLVDEVENLYSELKNKGFEPVKASSLKSINPSEKSSVCSVTLPIESIEKEICDVTEIKQVASVEVCDCSELLENCDGIEEEVRNLKELADKSEQLQYLLDESVKKCKFLSKESDVIRSERDFLQMVVENMKNQEQEYKASLSKAEDIVKMYDKVFSEKHKLLVEDCQELREKNNQLTKLIRSLNLTHDCQVSVTSMSKEVCSLWRIPPDKLANAHSVDSLAPKNTNDKVSDGITRQVPSRRRKHLSNRPSQKQRKPESRCSQKLCTTCVPQCSEGDIELLLSYESGELYPEKSICMN